MATDVRRHRLAGVLLGAALLGASGSASAQAQSPEPPDTAAERHDDAFHLDEALEGVLLSLRGLLLAIPQYEMPEVNDHGDIIIRRKPDPSDDPLQDPAEEPPIRPQDGPATRETGRI